jgi:hypothetical protein
MPAALSPLPLTLVGLHKPGVAGRGMLIAAAMEAVACIWVLVSEIEKVEEPLLAFGAAVLAFVPQLLSGMLFLVVHRSRRATQKAENETQTTT